MRLAWLLAVISITVTAHADEPDPSVMVRIRELYEKQDYEGVRRELLGAYEATPHPSLLFALGQVELALENCAAAIAYYEEFIATGPAEEQITLAQQAIGAARMCKKQPPPPLPPPPRRREWFVSDTVVVAAGGTFALAGVVLFSYGRSLGNDQEGSLTDYDKRVDRARTLQWTGTALASAGVLAVGITLVRWRLRPDDGEVITVSPGGVTVSGRW